MHRFINAWLELVPSEGGMEREIRFLSSFFILLLLLFPIELYYLCKLKRQWMNEYICMLKCSTDN